MQQVDTNLLIPKASIVFNRIFHFFGRPQKLIAQAEQSPRPNRILSNIDWHDSEQPSHDSCNRPVCGGYNEAFIVQHWASYHLK